MAQAGSANHAERGSSAAIAAPELIMAEQRHCAAAAPHRRGPRFPHCHAAQQSNGLFVPRSSPREP
jgi:hypothetical protein